MNTFKDLWLKTQQSVCTLEFFNDKGIKLNNLVGFKLDNYLITDVKFFEISAETTVKITFYKANGYAVYKQLEMSYINFFQRINKQIRPSIHAIVVFNFDFEEFKDIPSLKLGNFDCLMPGTQVAVIANNSNAQGIQLSPGMITSSCIKKFGRMYFQTNTVVNLESFGAPLINAETMELIGIVNMDGLNKHYDYEYISDLTKKNIQSLNEIDYNNSDAYLDIKETFIVMQNQLKYLAKMIMKYSDHGKVNVLNAKYLREFIEEVEVQEEISFSRSNENSYSNYESID